MDRSFIILGRRKLDGGSAGAPVRFLIVLLEKHDPAGRRTSWGSYQAGTWGKA